MALPLFSRADARAFDAAAIARGVSGLVLMENAARGATDVLFERLPGALGRPLLVGGLGQNGGDAWALGRQLVARGVTPAAIVLGDAAAVTGDARANLDALRALGVPMAAVTDAAQLPVLVATLESATVVVDGIFGTGLGRPIEGVVALAIAAMNARALPTLALDLPSGVDADTGAVLGAAVRATVTATFGAHKRGLLQHPGRGLCGDIVLCHIGVPAPALGPTTLLEPADLAALVPLRALDAHKGTAGHVLVLAGSPGKTGAALLAGMGAMRGGAGLVTLALRGAARAALDAKVVELMTTEVPEALEAGLLAVLRESEGKDALVVGPGLGLDAGARALAVRVALEAPLPVVLDADALTALTDAPAALRGARGPRILTPHPGEAGRLLGVGAGEIQEDRHQAAARLADLTGAVVVLKGAGTVVAGPGGRAAVCGPGTPALGVAGTGDVLCGAIGAMLAAGLGPLEAAMAGVLLHALAGEAAALADRGLLAHEVADAMPRALTAARRLAGARP